MCKLPEKHLRFNSLVKARRHAREVTGLDQMGGVPFIQRLGPFKDKYITGSQSLDGKRHWRIDWDTRGNKGFHVNWEYRNSKGDIVRGANIIEGKSYDDFLSVLEHFPRK